MLGGSFWTAFLRNGISAGLIMLVFLLLDRPKLPMKKTVRYYILFGCLVSFLFSVWYALDEKGFVRFSGVSVIAVVGSFCLLMSREKAYLSLYKIALGFYLLAITVVCGIDASRIWFGGDIWVDIVIRVIVVLAILLLILWKIRPNFLEGIEILEKEMSFFSIAALFASVMFVGFVALWPGERTLSVVRGARILVLFVLSGLIQYMVFRIYLHQGRERKYQMEKELLEMNGEFLYRQLKLMRESGKEAVRIRHDIRHHCLLIEEYIKNGENEKLLAYVRQYEGDVENGKVKRVCANETINSILTVYGRYAEKEKIKVTMDVKVAEEIAIRSIDLVAVLANIVENAIHGCLCSGKTEKEINLFIAQKGNKIVIRCTNTCTEDVEFRNGLPASASGGGVGISSIMKVVSDYNGETDFSVEDGMFVVKILMHLATGFESRTAMFE